MAYGVELIDYVKNKDDFKIESADIPPLGLPGLGVDIDKEFVIEQSKIEYDSLKEQKEKLQEFAESIGEENSPLHESFFEKAKNFFK